MKPHSSSNRGSTRRAPIAVDLFAGAGGVTAGYKRAGIRVVVAVERDPVACATYTSNHPEVTLIQRDIQRVTAREVRELIGRRTLDILTACSPCNSYSTLRRDGGTPLEKDLALIVLRFARVLRPRVVVIENVPRLASDRRFTRMRQTLRSFGYNVWWGILDAQDYGVPQRRRRLVLIARRDAPSTPPARARVVRTVDVAIRHLRASDPLNRAPTIKPTVLRRIRATRRNGGSRADLPEELRLACHDRLSSSAATNVYGRMRGNDVAPTLTTRCTTPACGRFIHPRANRPVTLREAACLQSFPRSYKFVGTRMEIERQIGNAVPVELSRRIAEHIARPPRLGSRAQV